MTAADTKAAGPPVPVPQCPGGDRDLALRAGNRRAAPEEAAEEGGTPPLPPDPAGDPGDRRRLRLPAGQDRDHVLPGPGTGGPLGQRRGPVGRLRAVHQHPRRPGVLVGRRENRRLHDRLRRADHGPRPAHRPDDAEGHHLGAARPHGGADRRLVHAAHGRRVGLPLALRLRLRPDQHAARRHHGQRGPVARPQLVPRPLAGLRHHHAPGRLGRHPVRRDHDVRGPHPGPQGAGGGGRPRRSHRRSASTAT